MLSSELQGKPQRTKGTLYFELEVSKALLCLDEYSLSSGWTSSAENQIYPNVFLDVLLLIFYLIYLQSHQILFCFL